MEGEEEEVEKQEPQPEAEPVQSQSFTFEGLNMNKNKYNNFNSNSINSKSNTNSMSNGKKATKSKMNVKVNGKTNKTKGDKSASMSTNDYWDVSTWSTAKMSGKERRAMQLATFQESLQLNFEESLDMTNFEKEKKSFQ